MADSGRILGRVVRTYDAVESTNDTLKELLEEGVPEGTVVVAKRQVSGRGRHGRAWFSPPGGLYFSFLLQPPERDAAPFSLLTGMPVVKALRHYGVLAYLRWPNDAHFMEKKVAGILGEGVYRREQFYAVIGIGVNTNVPLTALPEAIQKTATSVQHEERAVNHDEFLQYFLGHCDALYTRYKSGSRAMLFKEYRGLCTTIGKRVEADTGKGKVLGTAVDVALSGALIVLDEAGTRHEVLDADLRYV